MGNFQVTLHPVTTARTACLKFAVIVEKDEQGYYVASVPELPGCHTQGDTLTEVMKNAKEAKDLYIETLTEQEKKDILKQKIVGRHKSYKE